MLSFSFVIFQMERSLCCNFRSIEIHLFHEKVGSISLRHYLESHVFIFNRRCFDSGFCFIEIDFNFIFKREIVIFTALSKLLRNVAENCAINRIKLTKIAIEDF